MHVDKHQITIDIAAYGWQEQDWQGFYPADLPEDWRLGYYSNEFRSIVVPIDVWQDADRDSVEDWRDAVHAGFRFYFEVAAGQPPSKEQRLTLAPLKSQRGGWVCPVASAVDHTVPSLWYEGGAEPRRMRAAIESLHTGMGDSERGVIVVRSKLEPWQVATDMRQLVELMGFS